MHYGDRCNGEFVVHQGFFSGEHAGDELVLKLGMLVQAILSVAHLRLPPPALGCAKQDHSRPALAGVANQDPQYKAKSTLLSNLTVPT